MHNLFILKKHTLHTTLHFASPACSVTTKRKPNRLGNPEKNFQEMDFSGSAV